MRGTRRARICSACRIILSKAALLLLVTFSCYFLIDFSSSVTRHTYSFEKNYYTRAVELSDYLRTSINYTDPISIYILNETTSAFKDANNETISATLPIWIDKVPASVAGVIYNAQSFRVGILPTDTLIY
jgi:hypothetical protein